MEDANNRHRVAKSAHKRAAPTLDINEKTDGFITQIISDEMLSQHSQHSHHSHHSLLSHRSNQSNAESSKAVNVHLMDPNVLIPNKSSRHQAANQRNHPILPLNQSKSFVTFDEEPKKIATPPPPLVSNLSNIGKF